MRPIFIVVLLVIVAFGISYAGSVLSLGGGMILLTSLTIGAILGLLFS